MKPITTSANPWGSEVSMRQRLCTAIIAILVLVGMAAGVANAAPARLRSVTDNIQGPVGVSLDSQGNLYVADYSRGMVLVFNSKDQLLKSLSVPGALSVAVDSGNRVYVGSSSGQSKGIVSVYSKDLAFVRSLGKGLGEFSKPLSIAIDGADRVYIVDGIDNTVKVFDSAGQSALSFGGTGSDSGLLNKPVAIAVKDSAGEIYVSDRPITATSTGAQTYVPRVQVFDKTGKYLRSFGEYGGDAGKMIAPSGFSLDKSGMLYIADSNMGVVQLFDPSSGLSTDASAALYDSSHALLQPQGVAIGKNNIVYVASYVGKSIDLYALDGFVTMDSAPSLLSFSGTKYGANPAAQSITVANSGSGTLGWSAASNQAWLIPGQTTGSTGPAASANLPVSVNIAPLSAGTFTGTITVTADSGQTDSVPVTLTVQDPPTLGLSNQWLTFSAKKGTVVSPQSVTVSVSNATSLPWTAATDAASSSWLSMAPSSGNATTSSLISVNADSLAPGTYTGYLAFVATGALGGDGTSKIRVDLTVSSTNKINVKANIANASYSISSGGTTAYSGSGSTWSTDSAGTGDYTITFNRVAGYQRPLPQTKKLSEGGEITFDGVYVSYKDIAARRNIVVAKGPASNNTARVKAYKNDGNATAFEFTALKSRYGANSAVGDVDGDGVAELIVGAGAGEDNSALVRIYRADKSKLLEFTPFNTQYGVNVAVADFDGDGKAEVIVAPAGGAQNPAMVRIYAYDQTSNKMVPTGVDITASASMFGANVAAGDTEGDQKPELLTATGFDEDNPAVVTIWKIDTSKGLGSWTAAAIRDITLSGKGGASVAAGDVNDDGKDEIIASAGYDRQGASISIIRAEDGQLLSSITAFSNAKYGSSLAAADLDGDGIADIIAGVGGESGKERTKGKSAGVVKVFNAQGALSYTVTPFVAHQRERGLYRRPQCCADSAGADGGDSSFFGGSSSALRESLTRPLSSASSTLTFTTWPSLR